MISRRGGWLIRLSSGDQAVRSWRNVEGDGGQSAVPRGCNLRSLLLLGFLVAARRSCFFALLIRSFRRVNHDQISTNGAVVVADICAQIATAIFGGSRCLRGGRVVHATCIDWQTELVILFGGVLLGSRRNLLAYFLFGGTVVTGEGKVLYVLDLSL